MRSLLLSFLVVVIGSLLLNKGFLNAASKRGLYFDINVQMCVCFVGFIIYNITWFYGFIYILSSSLYPHSFITLDRNNYSHNKRVVCYVGTWSVYHKMDKFEIEDIDPHRCTHVMYGFAKIDEYKYTIQVFDPYQDESVNPWDKRKFLY